MRKKSIVFGVTIAFLGSLAFAQIDFSDFDDDLMRSMDDSVKYLDSNLSLKDAKSAKSDAETISEGLKWVEAYFVKKGGADDAVTIARQGLEHLDVMQKAIDANDFDKASAAARGIVRSCRACHDIYKTN